MKNFDFSDNNIIVTYNMPPKINFISLFNKKNIVSLNPNILW